MLNQMTHPDSLGPVDAERDEIRELSACEVEDVSGGFFAGHAAVLLAVYAGTAMMLMAGEYKQGVKDLS